MAHDLLGLLLDHILRPGNEFLRSHLLALKLVDSLFKVLLTYDVWVRQHIADDAGINPIE